MDAVVSNNNFNKRIMQTVIAYIVFIYLTYKAFKLLYTPVSYLYSPYDKTQTMACSGHEMLLIFIFSTGVLGIIPLLSLRLAILELLCVIGIIYSKNKPIFSIPIILYSIFIGWILMGLTYTKSVEYGIRMILKYIYPLLIALLSSAVVRDGEVFLKAMLNARKMALISIIVRSIPILGSLLGLVFWSGAALATHYIIITIFSLALFFFSNEKKQNLIWFAVFCLPCVLWVIRTDIMGTIIALSAFFIIKYRFKAVPIIAILACLSLASIFYIPSVKEKMFYNPNAVTIEDFLSNNVDEDNINTSGRKKGWEDCQRWFYEPHKLTGSGTGRVQTYFYTEAIGWQRGGQLHNDFLVLMCDNGLIGLSLFSLVYIAVLIHCIHLYKKHEDSMIKLCTITAGASLFGVMVTMYSDNTVSYSMATLSYPWGLYGMALGLIKNKQYVQSK